MIQAQPITRRQTVFLPALVAGIVSVVITLASFLAISALTATRTPTIDRQIVRAEALLQSGRDWQARYEQTSVDGLRHRQVMNYLASGVMQQAGHDWQLRYEQTLPTANR